MRYRLFGFAIESDIAFDGLAACVDAPRLELREDGEGASRAHVSWFHAFSRPDETPWLRVGRADGELVLDFCGGVVLRYGHDVVRWRRTQSIGDASFRHTMLDQALPLILAHQGLAVLHAACVTGEHGAVLLAGPAGVGKSTLAAALSDRYGAQVGDDATAVGVQECRVVAQPAYTAVRLWPDAAAALACHGGSPVWEDSDKRTYQGPSLAADVSTLESIYVLERGSDDTRIDVRRLTGREALLPLVRHTYVLDPDDRARVAALFATLAAIAARVRIRRLVMPHRFEALPAAVSQVGADLLAELRS